MVYNGKSFENGWYHFGIFWLCNPFYFNNSTNGQAEVRWSTTQYDKSKCDIAGAGRALRAGLPDHMSLKAPLLQRSRGHRPPNTAAFSEAPAGTKTLKLWGKKRFKFYSFLMFTVDFCTLCWHSAFTTAVSCSFQPQRMRSCATKRMRGLLSAYEIKTKYWNRLETELKHPRGLHDAQQDPRFSHTCRRPLVIILSFHVGIILAWVKK